jgi:hypothetical protein
MIKTVSRSDHAVSLLSSILARPALKGGRTGYLSNYLFFAFLLFFITTPVQAFLAETYYGANIKEKNGTSQNWSGYAIETNLRAPQSNVVSDVQGTWTVPVVTCAANTTYSAAWVGIDGYSDATVEQTGTEHNCINGQPFYYAWYEIYPQLPHQITLTIHPGDTISGEVNYANGGFTLKLNDLTTGNTFSTFQIVRANRQSAEWIAEAPASARAILPLANFGTIPFTNAQTTVNGITGPINNSTWQYTPLTMASVTTLKAQPSSLSAGGRSFSVTWSHF